MICQLIMFFFFCFTTWELWPRYEVSGTFSSEFPVSWWSTHIFDVSLLTSTVTNQLTYTLHNKSTIHNIHNVILILFIIINDDKMYWSSSDLQHGATHWLALSTQSKRGQDFIPPVGTKSKNSNDRNNFWGILFTIGKPQGCPLAPMLFVLCFEHLAALIRENHVTQGICRS